VVKFGQKINFPTGVEPGKEAVSPPQNKNILLLEMACLILQIN